MADERVSQPSVLGRYAGFVTRLAAFVVDRFITVAIVLVTTLAVQYVLDAFRINQLFGFGEISWQVAAISDTTFYLVVTVLYDIGFWMLAGQTPGKRLLGLRVLRTDGQRLRIGNAIRRELAYLVSAILFLGFLWILLDDRRQGWHDKLAGTIVVYSWPEEELQGTFIRDRVQRIVQERQMAQKGKSKA